MLGPPATILNQSSSALIIAPSISRNRVINAQQAW
jgi:hypothetical protein